MERSFSPSNKGLLRRDFVEAAPRERFLPLEGEKETVEIHLLGIEKKVWRRRQIKLLDGQGREHAVYVGYSKPGAFDEAVISYVRPDASQRPLGEFFFQRHGTDTAPFLRVEVENPSRKDAREAFEVYQQDPVTNPFLLTPKLVTASTEALHAEVERMAQSQNFDFPQGAQRAWDEYIWRQFSEAKEARDIRNQNLFDLALKGVRSREIAYSVDYCPSWARVRPIEENMTYFMEKSRTLTFQHHTQVECSYESLADQKPGDVLVVLPEDRSVSSMRAMNERRRKEVFEKRTNRISDQPLTLPEDDYPFSSMVGGGLTNGRSVDPVIVPKNRPFGLVEWKKHERIHPLQSIDKHNWPRMLEVTEGTYHRDLDRLEERVRESRKRDRQKARETAITKKIVGECLDMKVLDAVSRVDISFGERLLIEGMVKGKPICIVDSPNYGVGLYVFLKREDAAAWAGGDIDYKEARKRALRFIPHDQGWKERVMHVIEGME